MTLLYKNSLARVPMTEEEVLEIYKKIGINRFADKAKQKLCESHERLRAELDGAMSRVRELESQLHPEPPQ